MIYRKKIHNWTEKFGAYHTVWFYTREVKHESLVCYRQMEELPDVVEREFEDSDVTAVIQNYCTGEILKTYSCTR